MMFLTRLCVFVAVLLFLARGLRVAFQETTLDIEIPVDTITNAFLKLSTQVENSLLPPSIEQTIHKNDTVIVLRSNNVSQQDKKEEYYEWSRRPYEPNPRPPVEQVVKGWNVTGDPQWLINFAITAFPKCGTSTLMHYFANNPEVQIPEKERCELGANQHVPLIRDMYQEFPAGDFVRGIKCPSNLENDLSKKNFEKYFPKTDMLVGVRHPVKWFESFYNHRIQNDLEMRNMSDLIGACGKRSYGVCTNRASFHITLSQLGKTALTDRERKIFPPWAHRWYGKKLNLTNRIFFYDVEQLNDKNETRAKTFRKDLQRFLYLRNELPPMVWFKPGRKINIDQKKVDANKIDICGDEFVMLREELMQHAVNVSKWVREYFLASGTVHVSSRDHLETILADWNMDPCSDGGKYKAAIAAMNCTRYGCFLKEKPNQT
mmetsp:Transcript_11260/g.18650  ORF Transcript_11260/g.18650 Transcript_11260/m.18650 type:complete len:432 (-) Transcript_11260:1857-3152(-)